MAKVVFFYFLLILGISICLEAKNLKLKKTQMVFYMHDRRIDPKQQPDGTNLPIAQNPKSKLYTFNLGTVFVLDDPLTLGIDRNSTEIGRLHGTYINTELDGLDLYFLVSLVFADKKYNGSTIEIQGSNRIFLEYRDVSIAGGTGVFRMARGWITIETISIDAIALRAVVKLNMTVYHH